MSDNKKCAHACGNLGFGSIWMIGWLFTIGYVKLAFWPGALALIIWPYYLGEHIR